jgi:RimJ/RimL family protein N-acetyltransferase
MILSLEKKPFKKVLTGPRIKLIEARPAHAGSLWNSILRDREARGSSWDWLNNLDELKEYLSDNSCEEPKGEVFYLFQKDDQVFGSFHVHTLSYADHKTEIGYALEKSFEGHGYVAEAIELIEKELKRLGFNKMIISCDVNNVRSLKVAEKAGFKREGTLIQDCIENGKFRDSAIFGKIL